MIFLLHAATASVKFNESFFKQKTTPQEVNSSDLKDASNEFVVSSVEIQNRHLNHLSTVKQNYFAQHNDLKTPVASDSFSSVSNPFGPEYWHRLAMSCKNLGQLRISLDKEIINSPCLAASTTAPGPVLASRTFFSWSWVSSLLILGDVVGVVDGDDGALAGSGLANCRIKQGAPPLTAIAERRGRWRYSGGHHDWGGGRWRGTVQYF